MNFNYKAFAILLASSLPTLASTLEGANDYAVLQAFNTAVVAKHDTVEPDLMMRVALSEPNGGLHADVATFLDRRNVGSPLTAGAHYVYEYVHGPLLDAFSKTPAAKYPLAFYQEALKANLTTKLVALGAVLVVNGDTKVIGDALAEGDTVADLNATVNAANARQLDALVDAYIETKKAKPLVAEDKALLKAKHAVANAGIVVAGGDAVIVKAGKVLLEIAQAFKAQMGEQAELVFELNKPIQVKGGDWRAVTQANHFLAAHGLTLGAILDDATFNRLGA